MNSNNCYVTVATDPRVSAGKVALNAKQVTSLYYCIPTLAILFTMYMYIYEST